MAGYLDGPGLERFVQAGLRRSGRAAAARALAEDAGGGEPG